MKCHSYVRRSVHLVPRPRYIAQRRAIRQESRSSPVYLDTAVPEKDRSTNMHRTCSEWINFLVRVIHVLVHCCIRAVLIRHALWGRCLFTTDTACEVSRRCAIHGRRLGDPAAAEDRAGNRQEVACSPIWGACCCRERGSGEVGRMCSMWEDNK
jgi:hypothetical protein